MPRKKKQDPVEELLEFALSFPEATEGIACKGTPIEARTGMIRKKNFVMFHKDNIRCRLKAGLANARKVAKKMPQLEVADMGWIKFPFDDPKEIPVDQFKEWIEESYRSVAPKKLVATLDGDADGNTDAPPKGRARSRQRKK